MTNLWGTRVSCSLFFNFLLLLKPIKLADLWDTQQTFSKRHEHVRLNGCQSNCFWPRDTEPNIHTLCFSIFSYFWNPLNWLIHQTLNEPFLKGGIVWGKRTMKSLQLWKKIFSKFLSKIWTNWKLKVLSQKIQKFECISKTGVIFTIFFTTIL